MGYEHKFYHNWRKTEGLLSYAVQISESDLYIRSKTDLSAQVKELLLKYRLQIETYISNHPDFQKSLVPCPVEPLAVTIIKEMAAAAQKAGVGPMAAVAGAVAEFIGKALLKEADNELIIENGGDIFIASKQKRRVGLYAGKKMPLIFIELLSDEMPCGICTSSATLGPSLSLGKADAATVIADSATLADAAATTLGNALNSYKDIEYALENVLRIEGVRGAIAVIDGKVGIKGNIKLV